MSKIIKVKRFDEDAALISEAVEQIKSSENQRIINDLIAFGHLKVSEKPAHFVDLNDFDPAEDWIETYSGARFTPMAPKAGAICIQDIAHSLSMQCRFGGHSKNFYSVAQHSVLVSYLCDSKDALHGLLHDASEAYLVDVPRPIKRSGKIKEYVTLEKKLQETINFRFALTPAEPESVKMADYKLLVTEARDLLKRHRGDWSETVKPFPFTITPLPPNEAKRQFLDRFYELTDNLELYEELKKIDIF